MDRAISDLVGSLTDPVICHKGQEERPPEWLRNSITLERLIMNLAAQKGDTPTGTDAEAAWYLSTASLESPFDEQWTRIYCYVFTQVYERWRIKESGYSVPVDIKVDKLNDYDMSHLRRLKDWIYQTRIKARQEKDTSERKQRKEEEVKKKREEQPVLFDF
ncbi:MAG: hypothetical protein A9183_07210 [Dehalococcoides mccartyi]|nr:MAG: hypothetical protein A9183_07210 [Dehalococcoides mccartyi]